MLVHLKLVPGDGNKLWMNDFGSGFVGVFGTKVCKSKYLSLLLPKDGAFYLRRLLSFNQSLREIPLHQFWIVCSLTIFELVQQLLLAGLSTWNLPTMLNQVLEGRNYI